MNNPFAKFFGQASAEPQQPKVTWGGKPIEEYKDDDLPPDAEQVDCDCEGDPCACDEDILDDRGVIERQPGDQSKGGTLAANAKLGELNQGYKNRGPGAKARQLEKISFKKP